MEVIKPSPTRYVTLTSIANQLKKTNKEIRHLCRLLGVNILYIEYNNRFYIAVRDGERIKMRARQTLTKTARSLRTSTSRLRKVCSTLGIEIKKDGLLNYIDQPDIERLKEEIGAYEESPSIDDLQRRLEIAKEAKRNACGRDILGVSYSQFNEHSDISIYRSRDNWVCQGCRLGNRYDQRIDSLELLKEHVWNHINAGHNVPYYCTERIDEELKLLISES